MLHSGLNPHGPSPFLHGELRRFLYGIYHNRRIDTASCPGAARHRSATSLAARSWGPMIGDIKMFD